MVRTESLEQVQTDFAVAFRKGESVSEWIARFPEYALELAQLNLTLQAMYVEGEPADEDLARADRAMQRALVEFSQSSEAGPGIVARARELAIDLKDLATRVRLSIGVLYQIDRGFVTIESIPNRLQVDLAKHFNWPSTTDVRRFVAAPTGSSTHFSARGKPQGVDQQSFEQVLQEDEEVSTDDINWWIAIIRQDLEGKH